MKIKRLLIVAKDGDVDLLNKAKAMAYSVGYTLREAVLKLLRLWTSGKVKI